MQLNKMFARLRSAAARFAAAGDGNVALIFALAIIPAIGAVGAAIDYSRANSVRADMQGSLDATALMLSREAANDTNDQLQANALSYFSANYNRPGTTIGSISVTYTTTGGTQVVVNGSVLVPTDFMQFLGVNSITVNSSSTVKWGTSRLRVALVLDNTGSMADNGKIDALKTATNNLLGQLKSAAANNGDVYVSIIPFSTSVNVGATNYTQSWLTWTDYGKCNGSGHALSDSYTQALCNASGGNWSAYPSSKQQYWTGCVTDRGDTNGPSSSNYDTNVAMPAAGTPAALFPAVDYSSCPQQAMGLSYDWSSMTTLVNNMLPAGYTNQAVGLALGWMSLTGGGPFTAPAMDPTYTYSQIIILLTDGLNTKDHWYTDQASIDARQKMTCDNIKTAGITLYTIQVNTSGDPTSTLLQNCASSSDKFFLLTSANEIVTTFNAIGTDISKLYVAK